MINRLAHLLAARVVARTATVEAVTGGMPYPRRRFRGPDGGHPADDSPGTIRIHRADNWGDRHARRWKKDDDVESDCRWGLTTGFGTDAPAYVDDDYVASCTRRQPWQQFADVMGIR